MQNENVILAFLKLLLLLEVSRGGWLLVLLGLLNVYSRSQRQNKSSTYTYMQTKAKAKKKYKNTKKIANKTKLELFYVLQRSHGHKERLKRS